MQVNMYIANLCVQEQFAIFTAISNPLEDFKHDNERIWDICSASVDHIYHLLCSLGGICTL